MIFYVIYFPDLICAFLLKTGVFKRKSIVRFLIKFCYDKLFGVLIFSDQE